MPTNARQHNPIQRVAQSDQDYRQPEGGGGGGSKEIVEVTPALRDSLHGKLLAARTTLGASLQQWSNLPGVAKLLLREQALAKSHRPMYLLGRAEIPMIGAAGLGQLLLSVTPRTLTLLDEQITRCFGKAVPAHGPFWMLCGMTMGNLFEPQNREHFTNPTDFLCCLYGPLNDIANWQKVSAANFQKLLTMAADQFHDRRLAYTLGTRALAYFFVAGRLLET